MARTSMATFTIGGRASLLRYARKSGLILLAAGILLFLVIRAALTFDPSWCENAPNKDPTLVARYGLESLGKSAPRWGHAACEARPR